LSKRYNPGDIVTATITSLTRFGAFARLEEGVEGLIHVSSMKMPPNCRSVERFLDIGQEVDVRILHIDTERRRLGLGLVTVR
jgi:small subunit ribosomal protein S1